MLDKRTDIEVRVCPLGSNQGYTEYPAPTGSRFAETGVRTSFIEAVPGQKFSVHTIIHPRFPWKRLRATWVDVEIDIDGGTITKGSLIARPRPGDDATQTWRFRSTDQVVNNQLQQVYMAFRETKTSDDPDLLTGEEEINELQRRGRIEVEVQAGTARKVHYTKRQRIEQNIELLENVPLSKELPEESIKRVAIDNGRTHHTTLVPGELRDLPDPERDEGTKNTYTFTPGVGRYEKTVKFRFYYTSKEFLVRANVIPVPAAQLENAIEIDDLEDDADVLAAINEASDGDDGDFTPGAARHSTTTPDANAGHQTRTRKRARTAGADTSDARHQPIPRLESHVARQSELDEQIGRLKEKAKELTVEVLKVKQEHIQIKQEDGQASEAVNVFEQLQAKKDELATTYEKCAQLQIEGLKLKQANGRLELTDNELARKLVELRWEVANQDVYFLGRRVEKARAARNMQMTDLLSEQLEDRKSVCRQLLREKYRLLEEMGSKSEGESDQTEEA